MLIENIPLLTLDFKYLVVLTYVLEAFLLRRYVMNRTTPDRRREFYRRHLRGESYQDIADDVGVSHGCVRNWCRHQRDGGTCESRYHRDSPGILSTFHSLVRFAILRLKLAHPRRGPERIHYHLRRRQSCRGCRLPHPSSIGRYVHQWPRFHRPKAKVIPRSRPKPVTEVHQRWQIDFKTNIEQANGQKLTLHTLTDQYSGACIDAQLLPKETVTKRRARVTWREVQNSLRCGFSAWGTLPRSVQTDGESTLIGRAGMDFPTDFTLWLRGLGIVHSIIRSGVCTDNSEVERGHRTVNDYAIFGQEKKPVTDLQLMVHQAVQELAFDLPSRAKDCNGRPPTTAYPALLSAPRPYQLEQELALFDIKRIDAYLASFQWRRKVSKNGVIQLGGRRCKYFVGRKYAYRQFLICFDADDRYLVFFLEDDPEQEVCRLPLRGFSVHDLIGIEDPDVVLVPQQLPLLPDALRG